MIIQHKKDILHPHASIGFMHIIKWILDIIFNPCLNFFVQDLFWLLFMETWMQEFSNFCFNMGWLTHHDCDSSIRNHCSVLNTGQDALESSWFGIKLCLLLGTLFTSATKVLNKLFPVTYPNKFLLKNILAPNFFCPSNSQST